ncbi:MAG TPA: tRNA uridine-5-carboxymethylaminomethyl(34) synthesis GTPase MnmE [Bacteroidales bacterium]|nr:tRNA uridine-5-carboxymethylaminomethyl(34) synthesis GTPase MnmE [Bacteroidales bacterium]HOH21842.1 tRNA uridine-5-carboxymethylaminomethyl(34) synthesis GTPase MnmE [Bacteroidales bacterium]HPZ02738.1 tRNA uridine-5-carboxymethylaminomethyl(34) synthesis GTPase MnmE [Bacteroidales bacterium]HQB74362.1 tRNA uridine-5-carboxymethylaminomethyl(34) synthesis GTPase MnmE [Bacteroidales bacterium]
MNMVDTICSIATPPGRGALAVIRVSGSKAFEITGKLLKDPQKMLSQDPNQAKLYELYDTERLIDQAVLIKYVAPKSFSGEDMVEIICHGSTYIQEQILQLLLQAGARMAQPGEFSMRAFLNGKMDLPQAEAVSDLINSQSEASHRLAINQLKGNFTNRIKELRAQFVQLAALMELELDFSEEDVEFADRKQFNQLLDELQTDVTALIQSFKVGNVIKHGIPVAIIGKPNVGKSTLLNVLLDEDRAIVSHIPGTTRDTIEDNFTIDGINFRFIDTAGIRITKDEVESFGIERTFKAIDRAEVILYLVDITDTTIEEVEQELLFLENEIDFINKVFIIVANKIDKLEDFPSRFSTWNEYEIVYISARKNVNIDLLKEVLASQINKYAITDNTLLTNVRHYDLFLKIESSIKQIKEGLAEGLPTDIITIDLNHILHYLGEITGEITTDEILNTIFGHFCIGK